MMVYGLGSPSIQGRLKDYSTPRLFDWSAENPNIALHDGNHCIDAIEQRPRFFGDTDGNGNVGLHGISSKGS